MLSVAVGRRMTLGRSWEGYARVSAMSGHVDVSATCNADAVADPLNQTCFEGTPSRDRVAPLGVALEFAAAWQGWRSKHIEPYLSAGIRYERINFDVNYTRDIGTPANPHTYPALDDHNRAMLGRLARAATIIETSGPALLSDWLTGSCDQLDSLLLAEEDELAAAGYPELAFHRRLHDRARAMTRDDARYP